MQVFWAAHLDESHPELLLLQPSAPAVTAARTATKLNSWAYRANLLLTMLHLNQESDGTGQAKEACYGERTISRQPFGRLVRIRLCRLTRRQVRRTESG